MTYVEFPISVAHAVNLFNRPFYRNMMQRGIFLSNTEFFNSFPTGLLGTDRQMDGWTDGRQHSVRRPSGERAVQ